MYDTELEDYHKLVDDREKYHYEATRTEREHLEDMQNVIDVIKDVTGLDYLGVSDAEEIVESENPSEYINSYLDEEMTENQWLIIKNKLSL